MQNQPRLGERNDTLNGVCYRRWRQNRTLDWSRDGALDEAVRRTNAQRHLDADPESVYGQSYRETFGEAAGQALLDAGWNSPAQPNYREDPYQSEDGWCDEVPYYDL